MKRLFIVEDEKILRENLAELFVQKGYAVELAPQGRGALARIEEERFDLVIADVRLPKASGLEVLRLARMKDEGALVLVMTAYGSVDSAVEAMRWGAYDYIQKPFELEELEMKVMRAFERQRESRVLEALKTRELDGADIVFESPRMREVLALARRTAKTKATVLITGETGTGKEKIAEVIHRESWRSEHGLVKLNCTAFSPDALEGELFGTETGGRLRKVGRFELADEGTLFLDEIGHLPAPSQTRLLRAIQDQEFERIGGSKAIKVDVRVVASTNRNLEEAAGSGEFQRELLQRLSIVDIRVPPLRERKEDILTLARMFLERYCREMHRPLDGFTQDAERLLVEHSWPGNVRELNTAIERSVLMADRGRISADQISLFEVRPRAHARRPMGEPLPAGMELEELEREAIRQALERANWVQRKAAESLGVSSRVMNYKIRKYNFRNPRWRRYRSPESGS
ncbi:MAG TPA: sigma-54 dependent transcriptional regulator [Candidatus Polarisedimenticolia bacterium]|nr:sigma-54 dependent transcriptional regulator [Candidatus Polarisedimenticolia bacterium]